MTNNYPLNPRIIAHRGNSSEAPENTLAAINSALELNCDAIEIDLHLSKDGELIVMHDSQIDRTTNGTGNIMDMTVSELKQFDAGSWKGEAFKGEPIPTFSEVLKAVKGKSRLVVEMKVGGAEEKLLQELRSFDMLEDVVIISFYPDVCAKLNELMPDLPCSVLTAVSTFEEFVDVTRKAKTKAIDLYHARLEREVAEKLLDRAYVLWVWTVDDVKSMRRAVDLGITGITTNKPKLAIELFR